MITIEQRPAGFMGSNMDHIFTISSTNSSLTNFKFVIDVYFNPYETTAEKIGRIKIRPNTYGKGIFNVREIIRNYIKPNVRTEDANYRDLYSVSWSLNTTNPNANISILSGFTDSNAYNGTDPYEILNHTGSYRILCGEEYTSGGTTILNMPTNYWVPTDVKNFTETLDTGPAGYVGVPNRINWAGANSWDYGTNYGVFLSGYTYLHTDPGGAYVASGTSTADSGNYIATLEPSQNDLFYVWSNDLGCGYKFIWNCDVCETNGWNYVDTYSPTETPICSSASDLVRLTPAAEPSQYLTYLTDTFPTLIYGNTDYMFNFLMSKNATFGPAGLEGQSRYGNFYNKFGTDRTPYQTSGITISSTQQTTRFRHRQHHRNCPVLINYAVGDFGKYPNSTLNLLNNNRITDLVELRQTGTTNTLNYHTSYTPPYIPPTGNTYTPLNSIITNFNKYYWGTADLEDVKKVAFYTTEGTGTAYSSNGISNIYVFEFYGDECLYGDATHFIYLNTNGAWDTITFGTKNIKSLSTRRDVYAQDGLKDASSYMWGSWEQRNITYNQDTQVSVEAQSAWIDENDVELYRDFFLSNYVYQIVQNLNDDGALFSTLIPVTITDSTFEEYKSRYNKLYQYNMNYTYNTIKQFNTSL